MYSYGENNPIKNVDLDGDSVIVNSGERFNSYRGQIMTDVDITVTGKVENDSTAPYTGEQMQNFTDRLNTEIQHDYSVDGVDIKSTMHSKLSPASASNPVQPGDNVFRLVILMGFPPTWREYAAIAHALCTRAFIIFREMRQGLQRIPASRLRPEAV